MSLKSFILSLALAAVYVGLQGAAAWVHAQWIAAGAWPSHAMSGIYGVATAVCIAAVWMWRAKGTLLQAGFFVLLLLAIRWIAFDLALNHFRRLPWHYTGIPDYNDALLDSMGRWQFLMKAALLLVSGLLFFYSGRRKRQ